MPGLRSECVRRQFVCRLAAEWVMLALLGATVLVFFCPVAQGPYSAVRGPATTLTSIRSRRMLRQAMQLAAAHQPSRVPMPHIVRLLPAALSSAPLLRSIFSEPVSILRC